MHAVVLGRTCGDAQAACGTVAPLLGRSLTEVRSRLALVGGDPVVLAATRKPAPAREAVAVLVQHGFDAHLLDMRAPFGALFTARTFELTPHALAITAVLQTTSAVAWADVEAIVAGSIARAAPHSPLVPASSVNRLADALVQPLLVREEVTVSTGEEQLLFVVAGDRAIVLGEDRLDYRSLGAGVLPSRRANFERVVQTVRERCPGVPFDHRLQRVHTRAHILGPIAALDRALAISAAIVANDVRRGASDPYR